MKSLKTALACALLVASAMIIFTTKLVRFFKVQNNFPLMEELRIASKACSIAPCCVVSATLPLLRIGLALFPPSCLSNGRVPRGCLV
jgi:hypothetical protein